MSGVWRRKEEEAERQKKAADFRLRNDDMMVLAAYIKENKMTA